MKHEFPLSDTELLTKDRPFVSEIPRLRKLVAARGLVGLASNTKWNELITTMRNRGSEWTPSFRFSCIDTDYISSWDGEWWHHLPFPFISVSWFEIDFTQEIQRGVLLPAEIIDHSKDLQTLLRSIGFSFEKGKIAFRIYGYAPENRIGFE